MSSRNALMGEGLRMVAVGVGEYEVHDRPCIMHTLLGSCVAVCLRDPVTLVGGMNHILLPGRPDMECFNAEARWGINAMELLINGLIKKGADRYRFEAKVFGGGHLLDDITPDRSPGERNIEFVLEYLRLERIPVIKRDTGGIDARRIYFLPHTGEVFLKRVRRLAPGDISREERLGSRRASPDRRPPLLLFEGTRCAGVARSGKTEPGQGGCR